MSHRAVCLCMLGLSLCAGAVVGCGQSSAENPVPQPLAILTGAVPDGLVGTAYNQVLGASGGTEAGYGWQVVAGALPPGLSLAPTGTPSTTLSGTPTVPGSFSFTVEVTDAVGGTATAAFSLNVALPPLSIMTGTLADGVVGGAYSEPVVAVGGSGTGYTWQVVAGALPPGLGLALTGTPGTSLSGNPTAAGSFSFTVEVTDSASNTASQVFSLLVIPPPLSIISATPADGLAGASYSETIAATGGSGSGYAWQVISGALPPGLALAPAGTPSTTLSGTPTTAGIFSFTVEVTDSASNLASQAFSVTVNLAQLVIDSPGAAEGNAGSKALTFTVTLSSALTTPVTVDFATTDGTATAPSDYLTASGTVTFAPGVTTQAIDVTILGDVTVEPDETFAVTLSNAAGAQIATATGTGTIRNDESGSSDFNGDGLADLIVGAPGADAVYLFFGRASLPATIGANSADVRLTGVKTGDQFGVVVALGDVNGDGLADALVGAPLDDSGAPDAGAVYVFYGSTTPAASQSAASAGVAITGGGAGDQFGSDLTAGDVSGDTLADIIVGAPFADANGLDSGAVCVFFGASALPAVLSAANADVTLPGSAATDHFGTALAAADVNGDGTADLLASAPLADTGGGVNSGAMFGYYGSAALTGLVATSAADVVFTGAAGGDQIGLALAAGDIDGDGFDDAIIGAEKAQPSLVRTGAVYVMRGNSTLSGTISVATADLTLTGAANLDFFGSSVAAGDVDGDGLADILVGAELSDPAGNASGTASLFFGNPSLPATISATAADVTVQGAAAGDKLGSAAAVADWNGDGRAELIIGAPQVNGVGVDSGAAYAFLGTASLAGVFGAAAADVAITGAATGDQFGGSVGGHP